MGWGRALPLQCEQNLLCRPCGAGWVNKDETHESTTIQMRKTAITAQFGENSSNTCLSYNATDEKWNQKTGCERFPGGDCQEIIFKARKQLAY